MGTWELRSAECMSRGWERWGGCRSHCRGCLGDMGAAGEEDLGNVGPVAGEGLGDAGAVGLGGCKGPGGRGAAWGRGRVPWVTRGCVQVGWTRVNLAKKLLEKASGVTLVLKKIPLDQPSSPPYPRQQVSDPSTPSTAPVLHWAALGTRQ